MTALLDFFNNTEAFKDFIDGLGILGPVIFIVLVAAQVVLAFLPGEPFEIAAGYIFGLVKGTLFSLIGIVIGTAIVKIQQKNY